MKLMKPIQADNAYFIKLGEKGKWERECIEDTRTLKVGFTKTDHRACKAGRWEEIRQSYLALGLTPGKATQKTNEIRNFYEVGEDALWITFYAGRMWWCFAHCAVVKRSDGTKIRRVIGRWRDQDITGNNLTLDTISGNLLQVRRFQGTICSADPQYLARRINAADSKVVKEASASLQLMTASLIPLIRALHWQDFELLVDLIFSNAGWQRVGVLGKSEKSLDLNLLSPVTHERAMVQVKSRSNESEFREYCSRFSEMKKTFDSMFYVVHSPDTSLQNSKSPARVRFIGAEKLAELAVNAGLAKWLINKNR